MSVPCFCKYDVFQPIGQDQVNTCGHLVSIRCMVKVSQGLPLHPSHAQQGAQSPPPSAPHPDVKVLRFGWDWGQWRVGELNRADACKLAPGCPCLLILLLNGAQFRKLMRAVLTLVGAPYIPTKLTLVAFSTLFLLKIQITFVQLCSEQYRIRNHMGSYHASPQISYIYINILTLVARAPHLLNHLCTMRAEGHRSSRHLGPIDHLGAITPPEIIIQ